MTVSRVPAAALPPALLYALAFAIALTSCAAPLEAGERAFRRGDYPDAKATLASFDSAALAWPAARRTEHALYRALAYAALGDTTRAEVWLERAKGLLDSHPGALSDGDARRLETAWDAWCSTCTPAR